jgi:Mrp family chromosome partitioning ATPase
MSKNFELLQQAEINVDAPSVAYGRPDSLSVGRIKTNKGGYRRGTKLEDKIAGEESYKLVQNVFLLRREAAPRVVVFAGIDSGNGCSAICAQTAHILAVQRLGTVCVVDSNLRSPTLPELYGVGNHYGLTDSLLKQGAIREFAKVVGPDNLWLLSCGSRANESQTLLNSDMMKRRILELRKAFDYVLIDCPPLNIYADAISIGQMADGLVIILEANVTRRETAARVTENVRAAQINILGAVLNKRTYPIPASIYNRL